MTAFLITASGVILAALIGLAIKAYRSLITYEIFETNFELDLKDNKIVPASYDVSKIPTRISVYRVRLVNRGIKNVQDVKLHAEGEFNPFSIKKEASSISSEMITVGRKGDSIEFAIDFLPSKEEVTINFCDMSHRYLFKITGSGSGYKVRGLHYYLGQQETLGLLKSLAFSFLIIVCAALIYQSENTDVALEAPAAVDAISHTTPRSDGTTAQEPSQKTR